MDGPVGNFRTWASNLRLIWDSSITLTPKTKENTAGVEAASGTATSPIDQVVHGHNSIIETPSIQYPPIDRLPTELLLCIFHYDDSGVKYRLRLTHTCQRWREIAIASGSLWTSIDIMPDPTASNKEFDNFISLLDLQLERTQNLLLDVVWHASGRADRVAVVVKHIRRNGPFHRWRCLTISVMHIGYSFTDSFPNLESLVILPVHHSHAVLQVINLMTTSKLRTLDIRLSGARDEMVGRFYGPLLNRITRIVLFDSNTEDSVVRLPPFPVNITDIEAERRSTHPFPYAEKYKLAYGIFREGHIIDLQRLTTLIVTSSFSVHKNCQLVLPSLRRLVCANITLGHNAVLDAPLLEALEFCNDVRFILDMTQSRFGYIKDILGHPGYLLSPTKSLSLDMSLPPDLIIMMMTRYSRLKKLALRFNADLTVWKVTVAMSGKTRQTGFICPQLTELRLRFAREYRDFHGVEWWKDRAAQIVRGRRDLPVVLHIYGAWDEGEMFTLLD